MRDRSATTDDKTRVVELERIDACPMCRRPLGPEVFGTTYTDLWDNQDRHRFAYHRCDACDLILLANRPAFGKALGEFYAKKGGCSWLDWRHPNPLIRRYSDRLQRRKFELLQDLAPIGPASRVLEVGCGGGAFAAYLAENLGCEIHANDLDPSLAAQMHPAVTFHPGAFQDAAPTDWGLFDRVVSHQVVEHTYDPLAFIEAGYRLLKPGGVMLMETINIHSASFRVFQHNWSQLCAPRHTVLFSDRFFRERLPALLPGAQVRVDYVGYAGNMSRWSGSAIHALHLPMATSRVALAAAATMYVATNGVLAWLETATKERAIITVSVTRPPDHAVL